MKKVAVLVLCFAMNGCAGLGKFTENTFVPLNDPDAPHGESENFRRVRGEASLEAPVLAQPGEVWPGQPDAVPTIKDVNNPNSHFSRSFQRAIAGLRSTDGHQELANGEALSIGEKVSTESGVQRRSTSSAPGGLPSHVPDHASRYLEGPNRRSVAIPNGDGTTTLVSPDGVVRVVRGDASVILQQENAATFSRKEKNDSHTDSKIHHGSGDTSERE